MLPLSGLVLDSFKAFARQRDSELFLEVKWECLLCMCVVGGGGGGNNLLCMCVVGGGGNNLLCMCVVGGGQ